MPRFLTKLLSLFFPVRCPFCGAPVIADGTCEACASALPFTSQDYCPQCSKRWDACRCREHFAFERCVAPFFYTGSVKKAIGNFKFHGKNFSGMFARYTAETVKQRYMGIPFDFVTSVPLSRRELRKRGYNQSALFARALAKELSLPYHETLLKPRDIPPQRTLGAAARRVNVENAFASNISAAGKTVLLVDDIMTTGSTLDACARTLRGAGAQKIFCAVIASVNREKIVC